MEQNLNGNNSDEDFPLLIENPASEIKEKKKKKKAKPQKDEEELVTPENVEETELILSQKRIELEQKRKSKLTKVFITFERSVKTTMMRRVYKVFHQSLNSSVQNDYKYQVNNLEAKTELNKNEVILAAQNNDEETDLLIRKNRNHLEEEQESKFINRTNNKDMENIEKKEERRFSKTENDSIMILNKTKIEKESYFVLKEEETEINKPVIISLMELPKYKNFFITVHPFIINGYRINHSLKDCLKSIFTLHNETMNIWTHLLPFFIFFVLFVYNLIDHHFQSFMIVYLFMFTTFLFLLFSSMHHTFNCHSNDVWQCCYKMDLLGIMFQLVTATMCNLQFMFHDFDEVRKIYGYSFLALGSITIILSMFDFFISAKLNLLLMFSYATLFLISFLSTIHWVAIANFDEVETISPYILIGFVFIFIGFAIFLAKFPESIVQHKLIDYYFNSHVLWHLFVVAAVVCYYMTLDKYYCMVAED